MPDCAVIALNVGVLLRLSGLDVLDGNTLFLSPFPKAARARKGTAYSYLILGFIIGKTDWKADLMAFLICTEYFSCTMKLS